VATAATGSQVRVRGGASVVVIVTTEA
jgi:hypothetical protein